MPPLVRISNPLHATASRPGFTSCARPAVRAGRRHDGFTLVQLMFSMSIGSIVMAVCVPKVEQVKRQARATIIVSDMRTFASTFEAYAHEKGDWPAETAAGEIPPELAGQLASTAWQRVTPIGGQYNWDNNQQHVGVRYRAALSISETSIAPLPVDQDMLLEIDKLMDDGNLSTGNFRVGVNNDPLFIIQQ